MFVGLEDGKIEVRAVRSRDAARVAARGPRCAAFCSQASWSALGRPVAGLESGGGQAPGMLLQASWQALGVLSSGPWQALLCRALPGSPGYALPSAPMGRSDLEMPHSAPSRRRGGAAGISPYLVLWQARPLHGRFQSKRFRTSLNFASSKRVTNVLFWSTVV